MTLICVIGDLVGSRRVEDRMGLQDRLRMTLDSINGTRKEHLLSPCTITLGDEYQAVYGDADSLFLDFFTVLRDLYPEKVRFSVGIGSLQTELNPRLAIGMDGPAFHVAREAMKSPFRRSGCLFHIGQAGLDPPPWIGTALSLVSHEVKAWKPNRFLVFQRLLAGVDVKVIAEEARISTTAVYKNIQSGGLEAIRHLLAEIAQWVNQQVHP